MGFISMMAGAFFLWFSNIYWLRSHIIFGVQIHNGWRIFFMVFKYLLAPGRIHYMVFK